MCRLRPQDGFVEDAVWRRVVAKLGEWCEEFIAATPGEQVRACGECVTVCVCVCVCASVCAPGCVLYVEVM